MLKIKNIAQWMRASQRRGAQGLRGLMGLMGPKGLMGLIGRRRVLSFIIYSLLFIISSEFASAQIRIGGNVYGGGNHGNVSGSTKVTVEEGDIGHRPDPASSQPLDNPMGRVFGGARMGNVGGSSFVNIDGNGTNSEGYILINQVYAGNDVAGTIGTSATVPTELTCIRRKAGDETNVKLDSIDNTWNSFVRISTKVTGETYTAEDIALAGDDDEHNAWGKTPGVDSIPAADAKKIYIGQLFGGGNGEFTYTDEEGNPLRDGDDYIVMEGETIIARSATPFVRPEVDKTYLEVNGGSIVYAYGGGNNATVNEKTVIHVDNPSNVVNHIFVDKTTWAENTSATEETEDVINLLSNARFLDMGINTTFSQPSSGAYQVGRFFGGNNRAEMHIRPTWNLIAGKIRNLYSGGNSGDMTSPEGLLLEIKNYSSLIVDNLYGGCRMADVRPTVNGKYSPCTNIPGYHYPDGFSARVRIDGGNLNNIYGGNDVTGTVYGGNAVGVYTSIRGDIYGGGNGAYPYTDNEQLADNGTYGDLYYNPGSSTTAALKAFRPNAEQVSIRLYGDSEANPTVIKGSVYLGGNCSSLATKLEKPLVELKMGSNVIANNVFLGNNGAGMINPEYLKLYAGGLDENGEYTADGGQPYSSMDLTDASVMAEYMEGVTMTLQPSVVFDKVSNGDPDNYTDFSSSIGSFYCGGNVGSMGVAGKNIYHIDRGLNIFEKFVGGCNNADVPEGTYNAAFEGGVIGTADERGENEGEYFTDDGNSTGKIRDRIEINFENLTMTPKRWNDAGTELVWNTYKWGDVDPYYEAVEEGTTLTSGYTYYTSDSGAGEFKADGTEVADETHNYFVKQTKGFTKVEAVGTDPDHRRRLLGGNIYGGCYNSGHVNGNVVININEDVIRKEEIFGAAKSTVELEDQRDDLNTVAMSVFGAGHGEETEIWGSTTVNHNNGYAFQIYGGGEQGVVGKPRDVIDEHGIVTGREYYFDPAFSSTVNLNGASPIYSSDDTADDLAETEYIYGGGNEGDVCGNTYVNLGNGRIYDAFGGSSDADIYGHTEVIIGRQPNGSGGYKLGFPWIRDIVYGGNDFGGTIYGAYEDGFDATTRIRDYETNKEQMHGYAEGKHDYLLKSSAYIEYLQGRVDSIYGGSYGYYDYNHRPDLYGIGNSMPRQESAFVNLRPESNDRNSIAGIFGAGTGYPANREDDQAQDRSYILVDLTHDKNDGFKNVEIFGGGSYNGLGMRQEKEITFAPSYDRDKVSAIIDLLHGEIGNVYGGSYREGVTCRTVVNVPEESTIKVKNIFGGAYGLLILPPCDVIQTNVNYRNTSEQAVVTGAVYGGNNNQRRAIFTNVSISSPIWSDKSKGYLANVYGAGKGFNSWSEHTHVEMLSGAKVYEVYGGGEMGHVLNAETAQQYMQNNKAKPSVNIVEEAPWNDAARWDGGVGTGTVKDAYQEEWKTAWKDAWSLGHYYTPNITFDNYFETFAGLRSTSLVRKAEIDERDYSAFSEAEKNKRQYIYSTNVIINEGAEVVNYAYGGGLGSSATPFSGDVWGHTYIALLGGKVTKDIYAGGTAGAVNDAFARVGAYNASTNPYGFTASATAYVKGGSCRNVYGGGWEGNVGCHDGGISDPVTGSTDSPLDDDIPGNTYVVIGDLDGSSFTSGIPTIQRNAYGGGEGGAVYGTAHVKLNKGYIGYEYKGGAYVEKTEDDTKTTPNKLLEDAGCLFGGGYIDNSTVDKTHVTLNGGVVRNSVFGGGEVAAIGRGDMKEKSGGSGYELKGLYRPGKTLVDMFKGHVQRNVYGGGRGFDNLGRVGSLNCPGFVFGQTEVHIHGGEIGTEAGLAKGDGNVFGGGDIGHVYSAYENSDGTFGKGIKIGERYGVDAHQGYYYKHTWADSGVGSGFIMDGEENLLTEDCKVVVEPMCQVKLPVEIGGTGYAPGDFVPTAKLNTLGNKNSDSKWAYLDDAGIIIHNAVFAGGNNPSGAMATSANTASVFGNATASIHDVFHRDLITLGTGYTGGLYGDGNLTLVDGYRELNITNYGTDYYSIAKEITIDQYHALPAREAAYYELKYTCLQTCVDKDGTRYNPKDPENANSKASTITADDFFTLFKDVTGMIVVDDKPESPNYGKNIPNPAYWKESGVLPVYAGRLMNSIQRADFCGVFGSRMVMQGAQDRVPEEVDYTNYTINRVREVSLNKKESIAGDAVVHGNYFGIYNIVNYLGALTSDVDFGDDTSGDVRTTDNTDIATYQADANGKPYGTATFYDWKKEFHLQRKRNNGNSHNKVALASGVYLEITTEKSTGTGLYEKVWGPITGVVELDLINVAPGIGGGFVYAQNIHGKRKLSGKKNTILTGLNTGAITQKKFQYDDDGSASSDYTHDTEDGHYKTQWQSSGNFVHSTQTIIDDCYNISNRYMNGYKAPGGVPAHYWYIKGTTYVYDQYISAYTGSSNAYSEAVDIPLTIAAASHGKMKLLNVMPNRYAYYSAPGVKLESGKKMVINDNTYYANDPISYWDWYLLSTSERELFVEKTYTNCVSVSIDGGTLHEPGTLVMTDTEYNSYGTHTYTDAEGHTILNADKEIAGKDYIFRESNNASHDTGYLLTYEVNNPSKWDTWYTPKNTSYTGKIDKAEYDDLTSGQSDYEDGPTYRLKGSTSTMLGQKNYAEGDLISKNIEDTYQAVAVGNRPGGQATFQPAYLVTSKITVTEGGVDHNYYPGTAVSQTFALAHSGSVAEAYICTKTVQISKDNLILKDSKMTQTEWQTLYDKYNKVGATDADKKIAADLLAHVVPAYYCTVPGLYGGNYYVAGKNYRGLEAWSSMSESDREKFDFNYDALDLLIDPRYSKDKNNVVIHPEGQKYQYDSAAGTLAGAEANAAHYSLETPVDYTATYNGGTGDITETEGDKTGVDYMATSAIAGGKVYVDDELTREQFESLPNEQRHYAPIAVTDPGKYYVVNTPFQVGATPYAVGTTISAETYASLPNPGDVTVLTIDDAHKNQTYYYCREEYSGSVTAISSTDIPGAGGGVSGGNVQPGTLIIKTQYDGLPNEQRNFTIHGVSPTETSTLYVSRESDIYDLSKEKIITVIYQYDYEETDGTGNITPVSERHVLNIHLQFKSGVPIVEDIEKPDLILPGWFNTMREPEVTPGAYEVTGGGWELFETKSDAERHSNGIEYAPATDPLYWYQDGHYVAYYAKTYLGRTYSNAVPVSVANYHDMKAVMDAKEHHYYIDIPEAHKQRDPKIYINDYSASGANGLDLFKQLFDLSVLTGYTTDPKTGLISAGDFIGHKPIGEQVKGGDNLEFFLRADIDHGPTTEPNPAYVPEDPESPATITVEHPWTPIASGSAPCFSGTFHGDGHTITGLAPATGTTGSLFHNLCGSVYNLGVMGSFTGAGIADEGDGYVESCWVKTSAATTTLSPKPYPVFGAPSRTKPDGYNVYQVVNSYYYTGNKDLYTTMTGDAEITYANGSKGSVTSKTDKAFYNGELAYDLNNFYLFKRYNDNAKPSGSLSYKYYKPDQVDLETGKLVPQNGSYISHNDLCSSGFNGLQYVEDRFADGDFRYAAGEIPDTEDERFYSWIVDKGTPQEKELSSFYPIYPDDYIFFGQKLTYGWGAEAHQNVPTAVAREDGRLSLGDDANRVYRAPAYFRSKDMSVYHFNPTAYLAFKSNDGTKNVTETSMTAIDFAGHEQGHSQSSYKLGLDLTDNWFYSPLLDDDGLLSIKNCDETQNLLVYAPATSGDGYVNATTHGVLTSYFTDPAYEDHYDYHGGYRLVSENTDNIYGHLVQSDLTATNDHLLVDKQDFNAPLAYHFDASHLMWYQRKPSLKEYVDLNSGWQGISLPFTAELVTTDTKGEITHFYSGSETSKNGTDTKIGHEYWLRELTNNSDMTEKSAGVLKAKFDYPAAAGDAKEVPNTFLWDYYYQNSGIHNRKDANDDTYQRYYSTSRNYAAYPLLAAGTPYILGLPGKLYYEFDLSGNFEALNTAAAIPKLSKQIITFASNKGIGIGISDTEMDDGAVTAKYSSTDYAFKPSYMNQEFSAGTNSFVMNADGDSFDKVPASGDATTVAAFRPYFVVPSASTKGIFTRSIAFTSGTGEEFNEGPESALDGSLEIFVRGRHIVTRSHMAEPTTVRILNIGGVTVANFVLQPGQTIETPVQAHGAYIVNKKKVFVK